MSQDVPVVEYSGVSSEFIVSGGQAVQTSGRYEVLGIHGNGIISGTFVSDVRDVAVALSGVEESAADLSAKIRGPLSVYLRDKRTEQVFLLADPFGSGIVYYLRAVDKWFVSSSLPNLLAVLRQRRISTTKSLEYAALLSTANNGGIIPSPYKEISAIPQFSYIKFAMRDFTVIASESLPFSADQLNRTLSGQRALLEEVRADVLENLQVAARYAAPSYICHLTGGMDSRTVLAALMNTEYLSKFRVHCGGDPQSADMQISRRLAAHLGLEMTRESGVRAGVFPAGPTQESMWSMHETAGVLRAPANAGLRESRTMVLSGGYGGLLRNAYGGSLSIMPQAGFSGIELTNTILGQPSASESPTGGLLSGSLVEKARSRINSELENALSLGVPADAIPEYLWFTIRSRYFVGEISRSMSPYVKRFDPLYTPSLLSFAWSYSREERGMNFAHLDLLRSFSQEMALMPYDKPRIFDEYLELNPEISLHELPSASADFLEDFIPSVPYVPAISTPKISESQFALARKIGLPPETVGYSEMYRQTCLRISKELGESHLSEAFDVEQIKVLLNSPPRWRPQFRTLRDLHDSLIWFSS